MTFGSIRSFPDLLAYSRQQLVMHLVFQKHWEFCRRCCSMVFGGNEPKGGQDRWRWCSNRQGWCLVGGICFRNNGDTHDIRTSGNYRIAQEDVNPEFLGQSGWRQCNNCEMLFFIDNGLDDALSSEIGAMILKGVEIIKYVFGRDGMILKNFPNFHLSHSNTANIWHDNPIFGKLFYTNMK